MALYDILATISVPGLGTASSHVAPFSDSKVYVGKSDGVGILNGSNTFSSTIALPGNVAAGALLLSPDTTKLYAIGGGKINIINTATDSVTAGSITGAMPDYGWAINPSGTKMYGLQQYYALNPGNTSWGSVTVYDTTTNVVTATLTGFTTPRGVAVSPDGTKLYVANYNDSTVSVVNTSNNSIIATITGANSYPQVGAAVTPDGTKLYICCGIGGVRPINLSTNTAGSLIAGTHSWDLAISPDGKTVYSAGYGTTDVIVSSTTTDTVIKTITGFANANHVDFNKSGTRAYVSNTNGTLSVVEAKASSSSGFFSMF